MIWKHKTICNTVTESGVRQLATQKPIKRQGWWKGKFALFWMPTNWWGGARGGAGGGRLLSKARPPPDNQWARAFIGEGRGLLAETVQSALPVILKLVVWWSDQHHLDCFKYD